MEVREQRFDRNNIRWKMLLVLHAIINIYHFTLVVALSRHAMPVTHHITRP